MRSRGRVNHLLVGLRFAEGEMPDLRPGALREVGRVMVESLPADADLKDGDPRVRALDIANCGCHAFLLLLYASQWA